MVRSLSSRRTIHHAALPGATRAAPHRDTSYFGLPGVVDRT
ncbi:hypothetical protein ACN27J_03330 [Solwaraspora sp. WMMB762]